MARFVSGQSNFINLFGGGFVPNSPFTVSAWVHCRINQVSVGTGVLGASVNGGLEFRASPIGCDAVKQSIAGIGAAEGPLGLGWHHLIYTYANSGAFAFYIDGLPRGSGTNANQITISTTYFLGKTGNSEPFTGYISDFAITKFTITAAEAWLLGTGRMRPFTWRAGSANYSIYLALNGSTGETQELDYSGNGQTGNITGSCPVVPDPPQLNPTIVIRRGTIGSAFNAVAKTMRSNLVYTGYPTM